MITGKHHHAFIENNAYNFIWFAVCRENRYLLFLTENNAALEIMHRYLFQNEDIQPYVLFGSCFPKDKDYTQVCVLHPSTVCYKSIYTEWLF